MAEIQVLRYASYEDRKKQINGIPVGTAYSDAEFVSLVDGTGAKTILGYLDEGGKSLDYETVRRRFGNIGTPRVGFYSSEGEE